MALRSLELFSEVDLLLGWERWRTERLGGRCRKGIMALYVFSFCIVVMFYVYASVWLVNLLWYSKETLVRGGWGCSCFSVGLFCFWLLQGFFLVYCDSCFHFSVKMTKMTRLSSVVQAKTRVHDSVMFYPIFVHVLYVTASAGSASYTEA
jgi:hypothetical protein